MDNRDTVIKAVALIEERLREDITVLDLSQELGYSLFHFSRLFQGITGHSPRDYILKRRLTEAARTIQNTKGRLTDIAFDYQFNSYEAFARAFKRTFGVKPAELRGNISTWHLPFLNVIKAEDINHLRQIRDMEPEVVQLDTIYLAGMTTLVRGDMSIITELWSRFFIETENMEDVKKPESYYQLGFWPEKYDLEGFFIMCGAETKDFHYNNPMLSNKIIPPAEYLKFVHKGLSRNVGFTYKYIFQTWLPQSDFKPKIPYEFEYYGSDYLGPDNEKSQSEIYIPIKLL